ncbi:hypothetical protein [Lacisediminihabitans profunda]|uniref:DUF4913 domain-containing protein n=1 Tax=Lacisediminihabitans profunda TaxID=2594790 RepID=A0A5C8UN46_9MICO|nr:hypothetical protein [Lacisediminihabitans profunda]TXN29815.1 hypothetical protein FVP33_11765 [Lacisediminihabitans profunda]
MDEDSVPLFESPDSDEPESLDNEVGDPTDSLLLPEPPHPINWRVLSSEDAEAEWLELNGWVNWLRRTYGLPAAIIPPYWHRHPELLWELSALHLHWLGAYDPEQNGSAPIGWHADFAAARERLRDWVAASGSKLDRDRPTRQTIWPGEETPPDTGESNISDRDEDFVQFVAADAERRRKAEEEFYRGIADDSGSR